jgi:hypothetical protein
MNKYTMIGGSICAVVLIILGSFNNIIGYQTVQASNQKIITTEVSEKELLFQTIVDLVNNKEIQRVILGSELIGKGFYDPGMRSSTFTCPVITEKLLKQMYTLGVILTKTFSKSKIHSILERCHINNQGLQKEISAIVEKDTKLKEGVTQLSGLSCNCENSNVTWKYPFLCYLVLLPFFIFLFYIMTIPMMIIFQIAIHWVPWLLYVLEIWLVLLIATWYVSDLVLGCTWWSFIPL